MHSPPPGGRSWDVSSLEVAKHRGLLKYPCQSPERTEHEGTGPRCADKDRHDDTAVMAIPALLAQRECGQELRSQCHEPQAACSLAKPRGHTKNR